MLRIMKRKHVERTPERVDLLAKGMAEKIVIRSSGEISPEIAINLAYRVVARMDFDNNVQMHISLESYADRVVSAYKRNGISL